jgi:hypothetical protein
MTAWIQAYVEFFLVQNWKEGRSLYLRQIMRELDPEGAGYPDAGTLRKELEDLVFQGNLIKNPKRIVDKNGKARRVVCYEPTPKLMRT